MTKISKTQNGIYRREVVREIGDGKKDFDVVCRAVPLGDSAESAIVEAEVYCGEELFNRYILVVERRADYMRIRFVESTNLPAAMSKEGYSAVIERGSNQRPIVTADPAELLACIAKHHEDLVGPATVYRRIPE